MIKSTSRSGVTALVMCQLLFGGVALTSAQTMSGGMSGTMGSTMASMTGTEVGAMAPTATLMSLDGASVDLAKYIGRTPVVLEFWATWCPLCKKLEPQMEAARKAHGDKVTFIGIGVPENQSAEKQKQYVTEKKLGGIYLFDADGSVYKRFKATHTSYLVVIDAKGKIVYTGQGGDQKVEEAIAKAFPMMEQF